VLFGLKLSFLVILGLTAHPSLALDCRYYNAYVTAEKMATELRGQADPQWSDKAERLKKAINIRLWDESKGWRLRVAIRLKTCGSGPRLPWNKWDRPTHRISGNWLRLLKAGRPM
jgi:hypothetical protein